MQDAEDIKLVIPLPVAMLDDRALNAKQIASMACDVIHEAIERKVMEWRLANPVEDDG